MKTVNEYITLLRSYTRMNAEKYGITSIGIFGSVSRGEQREGSDLDIFVELHEADPVIMAYIHDDLQEICQCNVDLIRLRKGLNKHLIQRIEKDAIYA